jgi:hypothetical protein
MIRLFNVFCKLNFNKLLDLDLFFESMKEYSVDKIPFIELTCPCCGAKKPVWSYHDSYERYLISYENGITVEHTIEITRIICSSCNRTHAIIPEMLIPHGSYGLIFVLKVLKDYFAKMKIKEICMKYQISVSTLYKWIRLFQIHKTLWLGILQSFYQDAAYFLSTIPTTSTSNDLLNFFSQVGCSFLQGITKTAQFNTS